MVQKVEDPGPEVDKKGLDNAEYEARTGEDIVGVSKYVDMVDDNTLALTLGFLPSENLFLGASSAAVYLIIYRKSVRYEWSSC